MTKLEQPHEVNFGTTYSMLIYGEPGIGKTTTALSSPKPILFDFENGMKRVDPNFWQTRLQVTNIDDMYEVLDDAETMAQFQTIVIDPMSALIDVLIEDVAKKQPNLRKGSNLSIQGFGALKAAFNALWKRIQATNKNIVLVAHEKSEKLGEINYMTPDTGAGSSGRELIKNLDIIGRITRLNSKRTIYFDNDNSEFFSKNPFEFPKHIILPNPVTKNTFIIDTIDPAIEKHFQRMKQVRIDFQQLESKISALLDDIHDEETCNLAYQNLKAEYVNRGFMWKTKLAQIVKTLNLAFNKESGVFEHVVDHA
jgi:phage nucleotide-binding protein